MSLVAWHVIHKSYKKKKGKKQQQQQPRHKQNEFAYYFKGANHDSSKTKIPPTIREEKRQ